jgi:hypothetical protein
VEPGTANGIYTKPYTGFQRGGQANTPKMFHVQDRIDKLIIHFKLHYERFNLSNYNVPYINDDIMIDYLMPQDRVEMVGDEGTAPPVKKGYKP